LAVFTYVKLFVELGYRARDGGPAGVMDEEEMKGFVESLPGNGQDGQDGRECGGRDARAPGVDALVKCKIVQVVEGKFVCPRFIELNKHLMPGERSMAQRGGDMRAFRKGADKAQSKALELGFALSPEKLLDRDGNPHPAHLQQSAMVLISMLDKALYLGDRPAYLYTVELIQNAVAVLREHGADAAEPEARRLAVEKIDRMVELIAKRRGHPRLTGERPETLLPVMANVVRSLG
jgi:hypothetical protein